MTIDRSEGDLGTLAPIADDVAREEKGRARDYLPKGGFSVPRGLDWLSAGSLRHWAILTVASASVLAVLLQSTALLWREVVAARQEEEREVGALSRHVAEIAADPVARGDTEAARAALGALAASQNVLAAALYGAQGDLLVAVPIHGEEVAVPARAPDPGARRVGDGSRTSRRSVRPAVGSASSSSRRTRTSWGRGSCAPPPGSPPSSSSPFSWPWASGWPSTTVSGARFSRSRTPLAPSPGAATSTSALPRPGTRNCSTSPPTSTR